MLLWAITVEGCCTFSIIPSCCVAFVASAINDSSLKLNSLNIIGVLPVFLSQQLALEFSWTHLAAAALYFRLFKKPDGLHLKVFQGQEGSGGNSTGLC